MDLKKYISFFTHFCQHVACMTWPQLPVWVPTASSGGMKRGYAPSPLSEKYSKKTFIHTAGRDYMGLVDGYWPSALLVGIFPLHCVSTVDLWTQAVSTMAGAWGKTSCSSWQRMQVRISLSAGVDPLWGPMAMQSSLCFMVQLEK